MAAKDRQHCWIVRIDGELFDALMARKATLDTCYRASNGREISRTRLTRQLLRDGLKRELDAARAADARARQGSLFAGGTLERDE